MSLQLSTLNVIVNPKAHVGLRVDSSTFSSSSIFDFFDKKKVHFETQQPYQFRFRLIIPMIVFC